MANPFAAAAANPFAAAAAPANPFAPAPAAAPANPFAPAPAAAPANPFAPAPAAAPANPFAPAPAAAPAVNPFAAAAAPAAPAAAPVNPFAPAAAAAPAAPGAAAAAPAAGGAGAASLSAADAATYTDAVLQYDRKTALDQLSLSMTDASADPGLLDAFDAVVELLPRRALTQVYWDPLQPGEQPSIPPLMSVEEYSQLTVSACHRTCITAAQTSCSYPPPACGSHRPGPLPTFSSLYAKAAPSYTLRNRLRPLTPILLDRSATPHT